MVLCIGLVGPVYPGIFTPHVHPSLEFHGGINWGYRPWSIIGVHFLDGTAEALRSCVHSARVHTTEQYHNNVFRRSRESSVLLKTVLHRPSWRVPRGEHRRNRAEGLPLRYCQDACPGKDSWELLKEDAETSKTTSLALKTLSKSTSLFFRWFMLWITTNPPCKSD